MNNCAACEFFVGYQNPPGNPYGRCHRRAPVPVEVDELVRYGNPDQYKRVVTREWPEVQGNEGCGEWERKVRPVSDQEPF